MAGITFQDIFNAAWQAFIVEGKPPGKEVRDEYGTGPCRYLTREGNRCAVGWALPDDCEALESSVSFESLPGEFPGLFSPEVEDASPNYRRRFQDQMHDMIIEEGRFPADLKERYIQIAKDFQLDVPEATDVPAGWDRV